MSRNETARLVCPKCGYDLGEENLFRFYERKVADWLDGEVAAAYNPDFDVYNCTAFPDLTFQVKYSNPHFYKGRFKVQRWAFSQYRIRDGKPDYYVLIGITEKEKAHCFLLPRSTFMEMSSNTKGDERVLIAVPYQFSRRGGGKSTYVHENKFWKYEVTSKNGYSRIMSSVLKLQPSPQRRPPRLRRLRTRHERAP